MNHEHNAPTSPPPADPELEARIVAWVLGEASTEEIAALEHLVAARPELAAFKRRIEAVHGLVAEAAQQDREVGRFLRNRRSGRLQEAVAGEGGDAQSGRFGETSLPPEAEPLRLSPARRAKLLAAIGSPVAGGADPGRTTVQHKPAASAKPSAVRLPRPTERPWWRNEWFYSAAACVVISIGGFWMLGTVPEEYDLVSHVSQASDVRFESARYKAAEEADEELPEPMATVGLSEITTVIKAVPPSAPMSRSVPKAAAAPRIAPKPEAMLELAGLEAKKEAAPRRPSGGLPQRKVEVGAARGYAGTDDDGATGVLDPFVVKEDMPRTGYAAATTLAGTRLNTELKDIGSAVTVVTNEFMKDVGAPGNKSMLDYTTGSETGGPFGNFAGAPPTAKHDGFLSKRRGGRAAQPAPSAPVALGGLGGENAVDKDEEIVVLSPFEVTKDKSFLKGNRPQKRPKRPDPSATSAGMGPGDANVAANSQPVSADELARVQEVLDGAIAPPPPAIDQPLAKKPAPPPPTADEVSAAQEPVSTFSLHVSDASFKLALAALNSGRVPDAASIRPEEFYNAFDYGDPAPAAGEQVSCRLEQSAHPFAQPRNLVRLAVRVPATGRGGGTPLNLTVLLDTSGSMERPDRRAAVRAALQTLVGLLGPADRVTLIGFARQPRLLAEALDGNHANQTLDLLDRTPAEGGTNLEEALKLGGELARRHFATTAQNRIVLLTDGAANLGNADPERLAAAVESLRSQRIAFDACGVGLEGVDDDVLEALTRKGDGRYYVLNSTEAADAGFARQLAGAFRPAAENVKLQVRFNPARVGRYRLVGFEKHRLREEDFRNDAVDAAEISSEEAAVAVYEVEALPQGEGELGEVFVRFRDPTTRTMVERSWTLPYEPRAAAFDRSSPSLQLAGTAAALAEKLRGGPAGDRVDLDTLAPIVNAQRARRPDDKRIQDLATLFEQLRRMKQ